MTKNKTKKEYKSQYEIFQAYNSGKINSTEMYIQLGKFNE